MLIYKETLFVEMLFRNEMLPPDRFVQSFNTFVFLNFVDLYYSDKNVYMCLLNHHNEQFVERKYTMHHHRLKNHCAELHRP